MCSILYTFFISSDKFYIFIYNILANLLYSFTIRTEIENFVLVLIKTITIPYIKMLFGNY